jgi:polysaccharide biosynthesis protein PslG
MRKKNIIFIFLPLLLIGCGIFNLTSEGDSPGAENFSRFGIQLNLYTYFDDTDKMLAILEMAESAGVKWTREVFAMDWIMPAADTYDEDVLSSYDNMIDLARDHGIWVYGTIDYENSWLTENYYAPYEEPHFSAYGEFVAHIVDRYKNDISIWEIGNEPEAADFWKPEPNPLNYTELLKEGYTKAKEADPECTIIGFSGVSSAWDFLSEVIGYGGLEYMDILGLHPYCYLDATYKSIFEISDEFLIIDSIKAAMAEEKKELPIWVTEIGYPTNPGEYGVSEKRQADILVRTYISLLAAGIGQVSWYTIPDSGIDPENDENHMGLADSGLVPKDAYRAYSVMTEFLSPRRHIREIDAGDKIKAFLFTDPFFKSVLVAWAYDETILSGTGDPESGYELLSLKIDGSIDRINDLYGNIIDEPEDDLIRLKVNLSSSPVYIVGSFRID